MTIKHLRSLICIAIVGLWVVPAPAITLFSDNFNTDTSGTWTQNKAPTANAANQQAQFAFDYSPFGIPPAPGSTDTLGLRLRANLPIVAGNEVTTRPAGTTSGLSLSPTGQNFGTNYIVKFYAWSNFFGAPNEAGLADNGASMPLGPENAGDADRRGLIKLIDSRTWEPKGTFSTGPGAATFAAFSPDGQYLAAVDSAGRVYLWRAPRTATSGVPVVEQIVRFPPLDVLCN